MTLWSETLLLFPCSVFGRWQPLFWKGSCWFKRKRRRSDKSACSIFCKRTKARRWVSEAVERGTRTGWLTQSSPTTTIASLCQQRSWRGTLMALNGTRSLDITQNLLRLYCHVFPQFQFFEKSGYVCGMVKICSIMAKKIMPAEYAAKFMPCIPQRSSLQFEDWCSRYMKGQVSKRENKVNVGTVSELSHMAKLLRN